MAEAQRDSALSALQQAAAMAGPPGSPQEQVVVIQLLSPSGEASTAAVMKAPVDDKPVILSAGQADETGFTPAVEVPAAVLRDISAGGKPVVLVMGFMSDAMVTVLDLASSPPASPLASSPPSPKMASKPLSITLFDSEGHPLPKGMKLKEPILLTLQQNASAGATCAFWDEEAGAWSAEGVKRVQFSPGESASLTGPLVCATSHLTIFAAVIGLLAAAIFGTSQVLQTLVCSNAASIFSAKGAQALLRFSKATQTPVILLWVLLAFHVLCLLFAAWLDYLESFKSEEEQTEPTRTETKARRKYTCLGIEVGGFVSSIIDYLRCLPEALEKMVKDSIKSLGMKVGGFAWAIIDYMRCLPEAPEKMVRDSIKSIQAAKMGLCEESLKLVVVQRDEEIKLLPELKKRCSTREWTVQRINEDEDLAKKRLKETNWLGRVVMLLKAGHPWMLVFQSSIVRSHMVRLALIFCKMTGTAAAIALYYQGSGKTISYDSPDLDACAPKDDLMTKLIRVMTVGLASALMVDLFAPLLFIFRPKQTYNASSVSKHTVKKVVFWILFVIYNCLAIYIVLVFLANVSDADSNDWFVSVMVSLLKRLFLEPLGTAFGLGTLVTIVISCRPSIWKRACRTTMTCPLDEEDPQQQQQQQQQQTQQLTQQQQQQQLQQQLQQHQQQQQQHERQEDLHKLAECARDAEWDLVFEMLEKSPMLVNERPPGFDYAVHRAVIQGNLEVVSTLINRYRADPDLPSRYGERASEIAKNLGHKDLYCILSQREGTEHKTATSLHDHHHHPSHHHHQPSLPSSAVERPTAAVPNNDPYILHLSRPVLPGQVH
ncbi:unnamed protein product [Polarella glacialis]|uniref:GPS domain-containing protein n=1 Tax=Polarella glacialis TaxID=89957 RepID=A0A813I4E3_POLGL|nr:unnamed protein product [Polarella glacialis]